MTSFRFQDPLWLLLILPIIVMIAAARRRRGEEGIVFSSLETLSTLPVTMALRVKRCLPWMKAIGLILAAASVARPQRGLTEFRVRGDGVAIQICIDRSGSMQALDFERWGRRIDRLTVVKDVIRRFVRGGGGLPGRPHDLIGLVVFGGYAETITPLTHDHAALVNVLESVETPRPVTDAEGNVINQAWLEEEMATAMGDALALSVDRIRKSESRSKVVILLSDGENNAGAVDPRDAARAARSYGVKVYTIGVGSTGFAPFRVEDSSGRPVLIRRGVRLDERTLRSIAQTTGGRYFNARDSRTLQRIYEEIGKLEKTLLEGRRYTQYRELYQWLLLPGLFFVVFERLLSWTWLRALP